MSRTFEDLAKPGARECEIAIGCELGRSITSDLATGSCARMLTKHVSTAALETCHSLNLTTIKKSANNSCA